MSKLRKITRDDFNDTMNRLYIYGGPLSGYDFSNHDLRELNIGCYTEKYINCDFSNSDMTGMDMRDIIFVGCNFTNAKLDNANFTNTRLESCTLRTQTWLVQNLSKRILTELRLTTQIFHLRIYQTLLCLTLRLLIRIYRIQNLTTR